MAGSGRSGDADCFAERVSRHRDMAYSAARRLLPEPADAADATQDEAAIVYHASPALYMYFLEDASTRKVSTTDGADYRYPHCEAAPK